MENFITLDNKEELNKNKLVDTNIMELVENSKKCFKDENFSSCLYYLNLILLSPMIDVSTKTTILLMNSTVALKRKNGEELMRITRNLYKYLKVNLSNKITEEIFIMFVKILQKASQYCEDEGSLLHACWFIYDAKHVYETNKLKSDININSKENTHEILKNTLVNLIKKLGSQVNI